MADFGLVCAVCIGTLIAFAFLACAICCVDFSSQISCLKAEAVLRGYGRWATFKDGGVLFTWNDKPDEDTKGAE